MKHTHESLEMRYRFLPYQVGSDLTEKPAPKKQVLKKKLGEKRAEGLTDTVRDKLSAIGYQLYVFRYPLISPRVPRYRPGDVN